MLVAIGIPQERSIFLFPNLRGGFKKIGQKKSKEMVFERIAADPYL